MNKSDPKSKLQHLFNAAVRAADPMVSVAQFLPSAEGYRRVVVIGAGKASARMAEAAETVYPQCEGVVITRYGYARPCQRIEIVEAAHPIPDDAGAQATARMMDYVSDLSCDDLVIALISGGGSALLCAPLEGLSLSDKIETNAVLLASGAPISEMNIIRQQLSRVKAGQLAAACAPARVVGLLISDIPGDDPDLIASGPTVVPPRSASQSAQMAWRIVQDRALQLPARVCEVLQSRAQNGVPEVAFSDVENHIVAAPSQSLAAASDLAQTFGWQVELLGDAIEGEAVDVAREHVDHALMRQSQMTPTDPPLVILSGGECTVTRRGDGIGGPNAEYTLAAACVLDGHQGIHVLACDTDGVDGAAEVAGAYADGQTVSRAKMLGVLAQEALDQNNAHGFFEHLDDQIITGPTLTNVNDFRAILIYPHS